MKRKFLIWRANFYVPTMLTQPEICDIIKQKHERPVLNSRGEMLTSIDLDFEGDLQ